MEADLYPFTYFSAEDVLLIRAAVAFLFGSFLYKYLLTKIYEKTLCP